MTDPHHADLYRITSIEIENIRRELERIDPASLIAAGIEYSVDGDLLADRLNRPQDTHRDQLRPGLPRDSFLPGPTCQTAEDTPPPFPDGDLSEADLARRLQVAATIHGPNIRLSQFLHDLNLPYRQSAQVMATWTALRRAAGLPDAAPRAGRKQFTRDDLLAEFDRIKTLIGRDPTWSDLERHASISPSTFQLRLGNMPDIRQAHREWVELREKARSAD